MVAPLAVHLFAVALQGLIVSNLPAQSHVDIATRDYAEVNCSAYALGGYGQALPGRIADHKGTVGDALAWSDCHDPSVRRTALKAEPGEERVEYGTQLHVFFE